MNRFIGIVPAFLLAACGAVVTTGETRTDRHTVDLESTGPARLEIELNAGDLVVAGGPAQQFLEAEFTYNADRLTPAVERSSGNGRTIVKLRQPDASGFSMRNATSRWNVRVKENVPVEIAANMGAGEATMTVGSLDLRGLEVALGAGEVNVDLRGTPKHGYAVRISGGVGEAEVQLPAGVGVTATATGGLGSIDVQGLEKRGERWIRPGHEGHPVQLTVDVSGGVGEIRLVAE